MRSKTQTSLLQFFEWWGIDAWRGAGIDYTGQGASLSDQDCYCMFQHPWQSKKAWSRDDLIDMLALAERVFTAEAGFDPTPTQYLNEGHQYEFTHPLGYYQNDMKFKSVRPLTPHPSIVFGIEQFTELEAGASLVRDTNGDGTGLILDAFTLTISIPATLTNPNDLFFYFTGDDCTLLEKELGCEIRPVSHITLDLDLLTATISIPAYLLKRPDLDASDTCLAHEFAIYVETIDVYQRTIDTCQQGEWASDGEPCQNDECDEVRQSVCVTPRIIGCERWAVPKPYACDDTGAYVKYCLEWRPTSFYVNYIAGNPLDAETRRLDYISMESIGMLAVSLADVIGEWCKCDVTPQKKAEYFRGDNKMKVSEGVSTGLVGDTYRLLTNNQTLAFLQGLPITVGITRAMRFIDDLKCTKLEAGSMI